MRCQARIQECQVAAPISSPPHFVGMGRRRWKQFCSTRCAKSREGSAREGGRRCADAFFHMPEAVVDEQAAANMTLVDSGLLLGAFAPAEPWVERGVGYRQWRLLKGEANSEQSKGASSSSSSMTEVRSDLNANDFDVDHVLGDGNYSQVFQATLRSTQHKVVLKMIDKAKCGVVTNVYGGVCGVSCVQPPLQSRNCHAAGAGRVYPARWVKRTATADSDATRRTPNAPHGADRATSFYGTLRGSPTVRSRIIRYRRRFDIKSTADNE